MAGHKRYKHIDPKSNNPQWKLDKKRERIRQAVDILWAVLFFTVLCIGGINQHNDLICGWCFIIMGIVCIPVAIFYFYIDKKNWTPVFRYDNDDIRPYISQEKREQDIKNHRALRSVVAFVLLLLSLLLPLIGIFRILGMI